MAPAHSRTGRFLGVGALAAGSFAGVQAFLAPGAAPRAPAGPQTDAVGAPVPSAQRASTGHGYSALPSLVGATAALVAARCAPSRRQVLAAVATADAEIPLPFNPAKQVGAVQPLGYFDPLGFCREGDEQGFRKLRAAELKHGRVAMMASIGALGQHFVRFPGFEKTHGTFGAMLTGEGVLGFVVLFAASGVLELAWKDEKSREPGNFGDPFGVKMYNDDMRNKEISNGRMAMISVLGIFMAELATGKDAIEQFGLAAFRPTQAAASRQSGNSFAFTGSSRAPVIVHRGRPSAAVATADVEAPPPPPPFNPAEQLGAV